MNSTMRQKHLCEVSSMTHSYSLDIGIVCLHKCFLTLQASRIEWSDELRIQSLCSLMNAKEPSFSNKFGFDDGSNLPNGWKCKCYISQVPLLGPDGCFIYAYANVPVSWHGSIIAQDLCTRLLKLPGDCRLITDSEFLT